MGEHVLVGGECNAHARTRARASFLVLFQSLNVILLIDNKNSASLFGCSWLPRMLVDFLWIGESQRSNQHGCSMSGS